MSSVTFPTAYGGDGSTVTDDTSPTTGLRNGGYLTRFVPALSNTVAIAGYVATQASAASASAAAAAASQTAASGSATSANNSFLSMDKKWLGAKSSNPTVDNQGAALATGAAYFNTTAGETRVWNGTAWVSASVIGGTVASLNVTGNLVVGGAVVDSGRNITVNGSGVTSSTAPYFTVNSTALTGVDGTVFPAGGLLFSAYRDVRNPAYQAGITLEVYNAGGVQALPKALVFRLNGGSSGDNFANLGDSALPLEIACFDAAGNFGIGFRPSGWNIGRAFQIGTSGDASLLGFANAAYLSANAFYNGGWIYTATAPAAKYEESNGTHAWFVAPSGTAGGIIPFTQAQTLLNNGNRLLGTTTDGAAKDRVEVGSQTYLYEGLNAGTAVYRVLANGNVQNTNNSYGAISDAKLKDVVGPKPSTWDKTKQYNWVEYYLKTDIEQKHKLLGLVAQEAELISPGVVFQNTDLEEVEIVEQVTQEVPVTETQTVDQTITEPQLIDGRWTEVTTTKPVEQTVQLYDEFPLFDENGDPILEKVDDEWVQKMHRVPRTTTVTESVSRKEMQPTGTFTKGVKYSVVAMEYFRAFQEAQQRIETAESQISDLLNRVAALESA